MIQANFTEKELNKLLDFAKIAVESGGLWIVENSDGLGGSHHYGELCVPLFLFEKNAVSFPYLTSPIARIEKHDIEKLLNETLSIIERENHKVVLLDADEDFDIDLLPIELARFLEWALSGSDPLIEVV